LIHVLDIHTIVKSDRPVVIVLSILGSVDVFIACTSPVFVKIRFRDGGDRFLIYQVVDVLHDGLHDPWLVSDFSLQTLDEIHDHVVDTHVI